MTIERVFNEKDIHWDMKKPCDNCPFRLSTPMEKKGIESNILDMVRALTGDRQFLHSCHKTDARVTDGGFSPDYKGPVQHCMGFVLMCHKSQLDTLPMMRALKDGKLKTAQLGQTNLVHSFRELVRSFSEWAKVELAKRLEEEQGE